MDWPLHKLEDLTEPDRPITYGVVKPGPEDPDNGVKFIRGGDIFEGQLATDSLRTITTEVSKSYARTLLTGGELVVSLVGNPGHVAVVPKALAGANLARQAGLVALRKETDTDFIKYFLMSPQGRAALFAQMTGSVQIVINLHNLRTVRVPLPPLPIQRRIAGILSAYDELIENSQRRIRILETMARALYREWFIHFRYPGHESVPRVPSPLGEIPEGWEVKAFTEVADVLSGGTPKTDVAEYWNGDIPFFTPRDAPDCFYVQDTDKHVTELGLSKCASQLYPPDTVFITARGTVGKVALSSVPMAMNQSCYALRGKGDISQRSLFLLTLQQVDYLKTNTGGATFDTIVVDTFRRMQIVMPPRSTIAEFAGQVNAMFQEVDTLQRQIQTLRRTRDLLLPRLLSGQISVETIS